MTNQPIPLLNDPADLTTYVHDTFKTRDYYCAAFLVLHDIPLLKTRCIQGNRVEFLFANPHDEAYRLSTDLRAGNGADLVPLSLFRTAYRRIADAARDAKDSHYDDSRN